MDALFVVTVVLVVMAVPVVVWALFRLTDHIEHFEPDRDSNTPERSSTIRHRHTTWEHAPRTRTPRQASHTQGVR